MIPSYGGMVGAQAVLGPLLSILAVLGVIIAVSASDTPQFRAIGIAVAVVCGVAAIIAFFQMGGLV